VDLVEHENTQHQNICPSWFTINNVGQGECALGAWTTQLELAYTNDITQPQPTYIKHIAKTQSAYNSNMTKIKLVGNINIVKTQPTCIIPTA